MTRKIFISFFLIGISVLLLCGILFFGLQYKQTNDETYAALRQEAVYVKSGLFNGGAEYLKTLETGNRITWISSDGEVIYDNDFSDGNTDQKDCVEVRDAFENGEGKDIRKSESGGERMMYYAVLCEDGTVLRLGKPLSALLYALITVSPVLWMIVLVLILSVVLAYHASKRIVAPINSIDPDSPSSDIYPELTPLISKLRAQNLTIQEQIAELRRRQEEFSALTDNMSEGFLLVDRNGIIVSINRTAQVLLNNREIGEDINDVLTGEEKSILNKALDGESGVTISETDSQSWEYISNPIVTGSQITGAVLLMVNVTEREQREKLRQEFSANVSHELKTPLTSISGFAELISHGMTPDNKTREFAADIFKEAQRLILLIDDIIKLSKLDEGSVNYEWESVDLMLLAEDVTDSLRSSAEKRNITIELTGSHSCITGVYRLLYEMVYNLTDNSIKYNRENGKVNISVTEDDTHVRLSVSDTGIGIPYSEQNRVFERFYRVDKSHSKEIGGTGLGLSIVKHGAQYHGAAINLESEPGVGSTFTILFPKKI